VNSERAKIVRQERQLGFSGLRGKISECCDNWVVGLDQSGGLGWPIVYLLRFFILFPSKPAACFSRRSCYLIWHCIRVQLILKIQFALVAVWLSRFLMLL
jgi:hypothetical protein